MLSDISVYFTVEGLAGVDYLHGIIYLVAILVLLLLGKKLYQLFCPFSLDEELTKNDNKAVAVSFAGFMFALGWTLFTVLSGDSGKSLAWDLLDTAIWCLIGAGLLICAQKVNDLVIFRHFSNKKELVQDKNIGLGAAEAGSYVGTALILGACLTGEEVAFLTGLFGTVTFFICGQLAFILFAEFYQKITKFDFRKEIEADNPAVGVSFGLVLVALGILLSGPILVSVSLLFFIAWAIAGAIVLAITRVVLDKIVLPGAVLDREIHEDRNWGASVLIGALFIIIALLVNTAFLS
jgi:uncharacterized membrane protein YjfL (UPF0719 family)